MPPLSPARQSPNHPSPPIDQISPRPLIACTCLLMYIKTPTGDKASSENKIYSCFLEGFPRPIAFVSHFLPLSHLAHFYSAGLLSKSIILIPGTSACRVRSSHSRSIFSNSPRRRSPHASLNSAPYPTDLVCNFTRSFIVVLLLLALGHLKSSWEGIERRP